MPSLILCPLNLYIIVRSTWQYSGVLSPVPAIEKNQSFFLSFFLSSFPFITTVYVQSQHFKMAKSFVLQSKLFQNEPGRERAPRTFFPRECGNFPEMSLRNTECGNFPEISVRKVNSRKFPFLRPVKCSRSWTGTLFPHRRMYKNRVSEGINVPVSTWEFPLFWKVIFQREASFGSLFVTVQCSKFIYTLSLPSVYMKAHQL